jgi:uncharacterized protein (TIGR02145 family)
MAENLNYNASGSKCYKNETQNCDKYGRLYNWNTAKNACPVGWHLPSNAEWDKLYRYADGTSGTESPYHSKTTAGKHLKSKEGWNNSKEVKSSNGEDKFGFSALPGGLGGSDGNFYGVGYRGFWWCSNSYSRNMYYDYKGALYDYYDSKDRLHSVRCVGD